MRKIFLVDDHHIVRYGVKMILESNPDYQVTGESDSAENFLDKLPQIDAQLLITDISMSGMNGIELTRTVKKATNGNLKVLMLSMFADDLYISRAFEAGASGYMLKDFKKNELFIAIERIMSGQIYTSQSASNIIANSYLNKEFTKKSTSGTSVEVTKRERQIIELISMGHSNKEIAQNLNVSVGTVDVHRYNILKKLQSKNTAEMIMKSIKLNLITLKN